MTTSAQVRGLGRLVFDAVEGVTTIVEGMHRNISPTQSVLRPSQEGRTGGITGLVYRSIQLVNSGLRGGFDAALVPLESLAKHRNLSPAEETSLAILNGVVGDHLEASGNPLALSMRFRINGRALDLDAQSLRAALPNASGKLLLVVHGLCMNDLQWTRDGYNHADELAREQGYTPVYLHYNSGRHISVNGRAFATLLEALTAHWPAPLEELCLLTHSLGGLVARSACHYGAAGNHSWLKRLRKIVFLGTPHHGAPLERHGNKLQTFIGITPYSAPLARLGMLRSAGVTDLRYGNLLDEDWQSHDRFKPVADCRAKLPLPAGINCYAAAVTTGLRRGDLKDRLLADGLVPLHSALGQHRDADRCLIFPAAQQWIGHSMNHWDLLHRREVYEQLRRWLG